jgi:N-methylhydantoinase A/oxoprolinase/acetone carboxylase beta subunit
LASERHEAAASLLVPCAELTADRLGTAVAQLVAKVEGHERRTIARMRYRGQGHELDVPVQQYDSGATLADRFAALHGTRYGFTLPSEAEVVALRHEAGEPAHAAHFLRDPSRPAYDASTHTDAGGPANGVVVDGPTAMILPYATLWIASGWRAEALETGGWRLTRVSE